MPGTKPTTTSIETAAQRRERGRAEYEARTTGLIFTKDFQSNQDAIIRDPLATVGERFMAWIKRRSWGEYSLYAIRDDGEPAYQRDFANATGIAKQRVSATVDYYMDRGFLVVKLKMLYPVVSPRLTAPNPQKDKKSTPYRTFYENWKVTHVADFLEWEVARATDKKFRQVLIAEYRKSREAETKAERSLYRRKIVAETVAAGEGLSPLEANNRRHEENNARQKPPVAEGTQTRAQAAAFLLERIAAMQRQYPKTKFSKPILDPQNSGDMGLMYRILDELGSLEEEFLIGFLIHVTCKFKGFAWGGTFKTPRAPGDPSEIQGVGLLVNWAIDYARIEGTQQRRQA